MKACFSFFLLTCSIAVVAQDKTIAVDSHNYHVFVHGLEKRKAGEPIIIFENGMGVALENWKKVIDKLSAHTPVMAYDRAGIGKSAKIFQMPSVKFVATVYINC